MKLLKLHKTMEFLR